MNNDRIREITAIQTSAILISTIIGVGVLALPLFAVQSANSGGPLVTLLAVLFAFAGLALVAVLGMRFPRQTMLQYSEIIIGKWLSRICNFSIVVFFAILTSLAAREFGEVVITAVLQKTPVEVTVIVMLLLAAFSTRNDVLTFAYIHHFYFPLLIFPAVLIVALSLKNAEPLNLQPIWGNGRTNMLEGTLNIAALFQGSFVLITVMPHMKRPERALTATFWGMLIAGGLCVAIAVAAVGVFGSEETLKLLWPTLELAKTTSLPANILERLDAAFLAVWVTAVFTTLFSTYYLTIDKARRIFGMKEHKTLSLFLLPVVFFMAMLPQNILEMYEIIKSIGRIGLIVTIGYPAMLLLIAIIRNKRGDRSSEQKTVEND
ncbi:GerAB/ArcD/ProY family transporter [Cohnella algarum]|uniref:GerAB/ArcD/ProY family transporter n=1 Tax=Cohnella algarum TaxID=2044859 RepID=UPI0019683FAA|nr:endospore germination permease [Cohnella algarum]MBN2983098.1 endospore germination permease [Cohnella algarum]